MVASSNACRSTLRSLYEGLCLSFLTALDRKYHPTIKQLIVTHILALKNAHGVVKEQIKKPPTGNYVHCEGYWILQGDLEPHVDENVSQQTI